MRTKAKKTPMSLVSLVEIELKGLAPPGEALKILFRLHTPDARPLQLSSCPFDITMYLQRINIEIMSDSLDQLAP